MFILISMFFIVSLLILILGGMSLVLMENLFKRNKITSFECGFSSVGTLQKTFSMQFFSIMLLFLIFDIEVVLFLGLVVNFKMTPTILILFGFVIAGLWLEMYMGKLVWLN